LIAESDLDRDQVIALAAARLIAAARDGGEVTILDVPERTDRTNPAVELMTSDAVGSLAIEHTQIEPYPGQIADNHRIRPYAEALPEMLASSVPDGSRLALNLDVGAVIGIRPSTEVLELIAEWVAIVARSLVDGRPGIDGRHLAKGGPPELPFRLALVRWPQFPESPIPNVTIGWWRPDDLEERRQERLAVALAKKLPKLADAAGQGYAGVLVLESSDIQLSNSFDIQRALRTSATGAGSPIPSWIILWEQYGETAFVSISRANDAWIDEPQPQLLPAVPSDR
jgi:hypothetical protein